MISHRTIDSLYQAASRTRVIHITAEQFHSGKLKDLQMYDFDGLEFFQALHELWQRSEEGQYRMIESTKMGGKVTWIAGAAL